MQIHAASAIVEDITIRDYGTEGHQALEFPNGIDLIMQSQDDCERLITAAIEAKAHIYAREAEGEQP